MFGEVHGVDYFFKTRNEMESLYDQGQMIEMTEYHGNLYGTPTSLIEGAIQNAQQQSIILDEVGARKIKQMFSDRVLLVGVKAEREECARRLQLRGHHESDINTRLSSFETEIGALSQCDLILNNTDDNRETMDYIVLLFKEGLGKHNGSL